MLPIARCIHSPNDPIEPETRIPSPYSNKLRCHHFSSTYLSNQEELMDTDCCMLYLTFHPIRICTDAALRVIRWALITSDGSNSPASCMANLKSASVFGDRWRTYRFIQLQHSSIPLN